MNQLSNFALGVAVGIAGLYLTMHFALVRAEDGFHLVPKIAAKVEIPYTDIRKFTLGNWQTNKALTLAILRAKKGYLIQEPSLIGFKQANQQLLDQFSTKTTSKTGLAGLR
ncbi:MAG: hypothetical protein ACOVLE_16990 [Pirellula staleyi]